MHWVCHRDEPILVSGIFGEDLVSHFACRALVLATKPLYSIYLAKLIVKATYNEEKTLVSNHNGRNRQPTPGRVIFFSNQ